MDAVYSLRVFKKMLIPILPIQSSLFSLSKIESNSFTQIQKESRTPYHQLRLQQEISGAGQHRARFLLSVTSFSTIARPLSIQARGSCSIERHRRSQSQYYGFQMKVKVLFHSRALSESLAQAQKIISYQCSNFFPRGTLGSMKTRIGRIC